MTDTLDRRVTRLEVQVASFVTAAASQVQSDAAIHVAQQALIEKIDGQIDAEKEARQNAIAMERESRQQAIASEREMRQAALTSEREARLKLAADFRVFSARILVAVGVAVTIAQLALALFGPVIRHGLGLPS